MILSKIMVLFDVLVSKAYNRSIDNRIDNGGINMSNTNDKEKRLISYFESTSPIDMLKEISNGNPLQTDIDLAKDLVKVHGLSSGVVNVLLQYAYLKNEGNIARNYVERIASHWMNQRVRNAKEAMEIAKKEHQQYLRWKSDQF